jgi:peptide/nickel transport system substrate-binding protein
MKTLSLEARQAITYAIDRQAISDVAYNGQADLLEWGASKSLIETQDRYFNASEYYTDSPNLDKAKELATKAGLAGKTLTIVTNGDANYDTAAEVIQAALGELGAKASIIKKDQASYFDFLMSADVDAYDIAINTPVAPSNLPADIFGNYPTFIPQNWSGPEHDAYTKLAAETNATADLEAREDKVFELLKLHTENLLWFGLCEDPLVYAFSKDIKGTVYTVSGLTLFQTMTF